MSRVSSDTSSSRSIDQHAEGADFFTDDAEGGGDILVGREGGAGIDRHALRIAMKEPQSGLEIIGCRFARYDDGDTAARRFLKSGQDERACFD